VFPLRGKLLNVRDQTAKRVMENEELKHLRMILGLTPGKEYRTAEERAELRYGKVMLMTDQDHDGTLLCPHFF
jgi:DNA topoisomerase-2